MKALKYTAAFLLIPVFLVAAIVRETRNRLHMRRYILRRARHGVR